LVLLYNIPNIDIDKSLRKKLNHCWIGPFRVKTVSQLKGSYILEELNGTQKRRTYSGNRLKPFVQRDGYWFSLEDEPPTSSTAPKKVVVVEED